MTVRTTGVGSCERAFKAVNYFKQERYVCDAKMRFSYERRGEVVATWARIVLLLIGGPSPRAVLLVHDGLLVGEKSGCVIVPGPPPPRVRKSVSGRRGSYRSADACLVRCSWKGMRECFIPLVGTEYSSTLYPGLSGCVR